MAIKRKLNYEKVEEFDQKATEELAFHYKEILRLIGENPNREGLERTPLRVAKAIQFLTQGYALDPKEILSSAKFREDYREMVIVKDIEIYSLCEHHMVPFIGKAHVAYIPDKYITGLSKIDRVVDIYARRLQVQERLTMQIGMELQEMMGTEDVAVIIDAKHMCVSSRGIKDAASATITSFYGGKFNEEKIRNEFLHHLK